LPIKSRVNVFTNNREKSKIDRRMFTPTLVSKQADRKMTSNIFNYLHSYANKYNTNKAVREEQYNNQIKNFNQSKHTSTDSEQIYNNIKIEVFKKIFRVLDSDQDGIISIFNIDVRKLDNNIIKILQPILTELKEMEETLTEEEFIKACDHLYEVNGY
jgi:hypothetical protein